MDPYLLIAPDSTMYYVTPQAGKPRATKVYKGETSGFGSGLRRDQHGPETWKRLQPAFEWVG